MYRVVIGEFSLSSERKKESVVGSFTLSDIEEMIARKKKEVIEAGMKISIDAPLFLKWYDGDFLKYIFWAR